MIAENQRLLRVRDSDDELTCIICPIGCRLSVERAEDGALAVSGNKCRRGAAYAEEEFRDPRRVVTGTCAIENGTVFRLPVRSTEGVPVTEIAHYLNAMYELRLKAPIERGMVISANVGDTGVGLVATMTVPGRTPWLKDS